VFVENLRKADLRQDGWTLDDAGRPVAPAASARGTTVMDAVSAFVSIRWDTSWKTAKTKEKCRGRMLFVAAATLDDPASASAVLRALTDQQSNRGRRPEPGTVEAWAGRYLRDFAFDPAADQTDLAPALADARDWLAAHSLPIAALDDNALNDLHGRFAHLKYSTRRTYWSSTKALLRWLVVSGRLDRDPTLGMSRIERDLDAEQVDPERIPATAELWRLAETGEERWGVGIAALIVVLFFGALRIGEAAGLRRKHVTFLANDCAELSVRTQHDRVTSRYNDGETSLDDSTKGRTSGPGARRTVAIPPRAASVLRRHMNQAPDAGPNQYLFTQPRGGPLDADSFRRYRWNPLVEQVFGEGHRLEGITPHACRHGGMTFWLRRRVPLKRIQQMGGWHSLKVMLDVYAGVTPDDYEDTFTAIMDEEDEAYLSPAA
jgi:integrase